MPAKYADVRGSTKSYSVFFCVFREQLFGCGLWLRQIAARLQRFRGSMPQCIFARTVLKNS